MKRMTNQEFLAVLSKESKYAGRPLMALNFRGQMITLQFSSEPTREVFEYLRSFCEFEIATLEKLK